MDPKDVDVDALANQLRNPQGDFGNQVGETMATMNLPINEFAIECLQIRPTDHVLEIGFGPGVAAGMIADLTPDGHVAGIDHSPDMLAMAELRNRRAIMEERIEFTLGTADELPYDDESFHKVFAVNVLHFWPDGTKELAECFRVLKPGGTVLFFLTHPRSWFKGLGKTGVFIAREAQDIELMLARAGFTQTETRPFASEDGNGFAVLAKKAS